LLISRSDSTFGSSPLNPASCNILVSLALACIEVLRF
jgi:hypothetical protein